MNDKFIEFLVKMKENNEISAYALNKIISAYAENQGLNLQEIMSHRISENKKTENSTGHMSTQKKNNNKNAGITLILSLGILFILLAGTIFGTSTWNYYGNGIKVSLLLSVCILFFGMNIFTEKILKIEKTAMAFWILGILFLPIILLLIQGFGLAGEYFSFSGDGKFIYEIVIALICLLVFIYSLKKYSNILFLWFALVDSLFLNILILFQIDLRDIYAVLLEWALYLFILGVIEYLLKKRFYVYQISKNIEHYCIIILCAINLGFLVHLLWIGVSNIIGKYIDRNYTLTALSSALIITIMNLYRFYKNKIVIGVVSAISLRYILDIICCMTGISNKYIYYSIFTLLCIFFAFMVINIINIIMKENIFKLIFSIASVVIMGTLLIESWFILKDLKYIISALAAVIMIGCTALLMKEKNKAFCSIPMFYLSLALINLSWVCHKASIRAAAMILVALFIEAVRSLVCLKNKNLFIIMPFKCCEGFLIFISYLNVIANDITFLYSTAIIILFAFFVLRLRNLTQNKNLQIIYMYAAAFFFYYSYINVINNIEILHGYKMFFTLIPSVIIIKKLSEPNIVCEVINYIWYGICSFILLIYVSAEDYKKVVLLGIIYLAGIICGYIIKSKMYFLGGIISEIILIIINTEELWSSIPWWIYLLIGGIILIGFACNREINKNKKEKKHINIILKEKFKDWQ